MSITHSERAFVNLSNQHAMCMSHIVICGLSGFTILSIISKKVRLSGEKKQLLNKKMCVFYLCNIWLEHSSFREELSEIWSQMYTRLHIKYQIFLSDINKILIITYVVQQDTKFLIWLDIYSQYVWQLDMFRTYRSILRSIYKLCVAGLVCEDCVLLGASIR